MSTELGGNQVSPSPPSSTDKLSPLTRPLRRRLEEEGRRPDKAFRRYASNVERALSLFDTALQEWADYISFLGRLLKAIQSHPPACDILPDNSAVAKRLAQCLSPSLPSGVHQKAIEVYAYVFTLLGKQRLSQDLPIYLPGLAPVLSFASLSVRPYFFSLVETHLLPLHANALRPALKALLLSLLPGLEEENSEDFDRTLQILDSLKVAVNSKNHSNGMAGNGSGDDFFWQCFFLAVVTSPSRRLGAINFLTKRLPNLTAQISQDTTIDDAERNPEEPEALSAEAEAVVTPEPGLLIRCFVVGLGDAQLLIQRGFLDLLLSRLPLNSPVLAHHAEFKDRERLMAAATGVVARRDMSLNRRLWSWFLGSSTTNGMSDGGDPHSPRESRPESAQKQPRSGASYFNTYGAEHLTKALLNMFTQDSPTAVVRARPFRICLSLMDRWEVGTMISPKLFLPAMKVLSQYKSTASSDDFGDVLRSANGFFDSIESRIIWGQLIKLVRASFSPEKSSDHARLENLELAKFIVTTFNVREEDMLMLHLPLFIITTLVLVTVNEDRGVQRLSRQVIDSALGIADILIALLPSGVFLKPSSLETPNSELRASDLLKGENILSAVDEYYRQETLNTKLPKLPFAICDVRDAVVTQAAALLMRALDPQSSASTPLLRARLLTSLLANIDDQKDIYGEKLLESINQKFSEFTARSIVHPIVPFASLSAVLLVLAQFLPAETPAMQKNSQSLIATVIKSLWAFLSPGLPNHHVEAVRHLWQLNDLTVENSLVEASLTSFIADSAEADMPLDNRVESAKRLAVLWTHTASIPSLSMRKTSSFLGRNVSVGSDYNKALGQKELLSLLHRPLLILLDARSDPDSDLQIFIQDWLKSLPEVSSILEFLLNRILATSKNQISVSESEDANQNTRLQEESRDTSTQCLYYLHHFLDFLRLASDNVLLALISEVSTDAGDGTEHNPMRKVMAGLCQQIIQSREIYKLEQRKIDTEVQRTASSILSLLLRSPSAGILKDSNFEEPFIDLLRASLKKRPPAPSLQLAFMEVVLAALELKARPNAQYKPIHGRTSSLEATKTLSRIPVNTEDRESQDSPGLTSSPPPANLVQCLQEGISSTSSHTIIDSWIGFLIECVPHIGNMLFRVLIPLVECLCRKISQTFKNLQDAFLTTSVQQEDSPERVIQSLLTGLDYLLAAAHERLALEETKGVAPKSPEPTPQGFFGNVVSGVFSTELPKFRAATANTRLTVLLSFQDAIRNCLEIWSWGSRSQGEVNEDMTSVASLAYLSQRLRNKARRQLDRMFAAEPLESLETLIVQWTKSTYSSNALGPSSVMRLLHVLDASKPKVTISAVFHAIYSRTNPDALDPSRISTLTADLTDIDLVTFLIEYTRSLDEDTMDEIWTDSMAFMRDVLTNPLPHRQILPGLLLFVPILAEKMEHTNFGEQRKVRKELADMFVRLLTASFTTRSFGSSHSLMPIDEKINASKGQEPLREASLRRMIKSPDMTEVLAELIPTFQVILPDNERQSSATSTISTSIISPVMHAKSFPETVKPSTLDLLHNLTKLSSASRVWKKDVSDAFNHSKFFSTSLILVEYKWLPILRQWSLGEATRISEILSRIVAPTSAGIMFGVGASSARLEADKKTQLNLRRVTLLILAADSDFAVPQLSAIEEKTVELLTANATSSPSSLTRAEIFMLLRALLLRISPIHLSPLWPIINAELQKALSSALPRNEHRDTYHPSSLLQACKLLDQLVAIAPDEFQLHEWLFITDTVDAVYRPATWEPIGLLDDLADELGFGGPMLSPMPLSAQLSYLDSQSRPLLLDLDDSVAVNSSKEELVSRVLRPFFSQLSVKAFEAVYGMAAPDLDACRGALLRDLFNDGTFVG